MRPWPDSALQPTAITLIVFDSVFWLGEVTGAVTQLGAVDMVATRNL